MSHIQHQLYFDPNLTHEQCTHLLNNLNGIEAEFLCILYDFVKELDISKDNRDDLLENLEILADSITVIAIDSTTNPSDTSDSSTDDEDSSYDQTDSEDGDSHDGLENMILDEMEYEHDSAASP